MPTSFHDKVTLRGFHWEYSSLTFNLAAGITAADVGKAVSLNGVVPNSVKLAADGDNIVGYLSTYEDRTVEGIKVGAVELQFANLLPIAASAQATLAVGNSVVGAGNGEVKAAATHNPRNNFVAEIIGTKAVVVQV
jgi:hypothetical protein